MNLVDTRNGRRDVTRQVGLDDPVRQAEAELARVPSAVEATVAEFAAELEAAKPLPCLSRCIYWPQCACAQLPQGGA